MQKIIVLTGAGISRESGITTFRDSDGLWANYRIEDVCTPEALENNRETVIEFYNLRRKELLSVEPNAGHIALKELEKKFDVQIITQNVDDLHERAGSTNILHLHGELTKLRSSKNENLIYPLNGYKQELDAVSKDDGSLLRPYIVFFGEAVPKFEEAVALASSADILIIVGTSLAVYPAASLVQYVGNDVPIFLVDPNPPKVLNSNNITVIESTAAVAVPKLVNELLKQV